MRITIVRSSQWRPKLGFGFNRKTLLSVLTVVLLVLGAFTFGFVSSLHLKSSESAELGKQYLLPKGDAPPSVRGEVQATLRDFQEGYVKRDPQELDSFMNRLFSKADDVLLLGTDAGEWARGYPAVAAFIKTDWLEWGDFRFSANDSIIWSSGDVAWIASVGTVRGHGSDRPVRFSAILARNGSSWQFRQLHFQWDDRDASAADLLRLSTYQELAKWLLQRTRQIALGANRDRPQSLNSSATHSRPLTAPRPRAQMRSCGAGERNQRGGNATSPKTLAGARMTA
jgi:ketosteroid isomerase-like protein